MGDFEALALAKVESPVEYHPVEILNLTLVCYESKRHINDEPENFTQFVIVLFFMVQKTLCICLSDSYQTGNSAWRVV